MADEWSGDFDPLADPEEKKHLLSVLDSFRGYRKRSHHYCTHSRRQAFYSLPSQHWQLLSKHPFSLLDSFNQMDDLIDVNAALAEAIFIAGFNTYIAPSLDSEWVASILDPNVARDEFQLYSKILDHLDGHATVTDVNKARSCINQFYREWSEEGRVERNKCFDPVLQMLETEFTSRDLSDKSDKASIRVLVPGAGLGRLVYDICCAGYTVQGNEISYHELMASTLVLNQMEKVGQYTIAPWVLNVSNHLRREDQFKTYAIPDVHPVQELNKASEGLRIHAGERMSMAAGDFCVIYRGPDQASTFDVVATVFFVDTAPNLIRYIETVQNCLKPGGIWINLGPLKWHHLKSEGENENKPKSPRKVEGAGTAYETEDAGVGDPGSFELTNEEVIKLVEYCGFKIEKNETGGIDTGYISNPHSMLQYTYRPSFWVARKN